MNKIPEIHVQLHEILNSEKMVIDNSTGEVYHMPGQRHSEGDDYQIITLSAYFDFILADESDSKIYIELVNYKGKINHE